MLTCIRIFTHSFIHATHKHAYGDFISKYNTSLVIFDFIDTLYVYGVWDYKKILYSDIKKYVI